jgi:hypothetical protein
MPVHCRGLYCSRFLAAAGAAAVLLVGSALFFGPLPASEAATPNELAKAGTPAPDLAVAKPGLNAEDAAQVRPRFDLGGLAKRAPQRLPRPTEKELLAQLLSVTQVSVELDAKARRDLVALVQKQDASGDRHEHGPLLPAAQQSVLQGLPLIMGKACRTEGTQALAFFKAVAKVRETLGPSSDPSLPDGCANVNRLRSYTTTLASQESGARACLQMLQPGDSMIRDCLVEVLAKTPGPEASKALALRAITDLSPQVRAEARKALANRPAEEYQQVLVNYLNHPWAPLSGHAADALVELDARGAVPALVQLLREPDATEARTVEVNGVKQKALPEMVRINHLKSCMLCHASTTNGALGMHGGNSTLIAAVPTPGQPLSPSSGGYGSQGDLLVRVDVTYLRQDFSITQPVTNNGAWPDQQRFDFVVRMTPVSDHLAKLINRRFEKRGTSPQRDNLLHALRTLTGRDLGRTYQDWQPVLASAAKGR